MSIALQRPFGHYGGHCWLISIDKVRFPESDGVHDPNGSCLVMSEDGVDLGPGHVSHQEIALHGSGRYAHWDHALYFSASDQSDPNTNGRSYSVRWDADLYFRRRANYAVGVMQNWFRHLPGGAAALAGRDVVEIGPGRDMGTVLAFACLGARVFAVDRFFGGWQSGWHDLFLPRLADALSEAGWTIDRAPIERALAASSFLVEPISVITRSLEEMDDKFHGLADASFSQSTFEHFHSFEAAAVALRRASRPGSIGVHHVDFRDHRNFGEPFEFLLLDDRAYADPETNETFKRGNRVRPQRMGAILRDAGFARVEFTPTGQVAPDYLESFLPRLRTSQSPFNRVAESEFQVTGGCFVLGV